MRNDPILTKIRPDFSVEDARAALDYDPETGEFRWKCRPAYRIQLGDIAGSLNARGYLLIKLGGKNVAAHRLAMFITYGLWPAEEVDHVNGNRTDNRLANLRPSTHSQNQMNKPKRRNNSSGHKGVSWASRDRRWVAQIKYNGRHEVVGRFTDKSEAEAAYRARASVVHGEFQRG